MNNAKKLIFSLLFLLVITAGCVGKPPSEEETAASAPSEKETGVSTPPTDFVPYQNDDYSASSPSAWEVEEHESFVYFKTPLESDSNNLQENVVIYVASLVSPGQDLIHFVQDSVGLLIETTPELRILDHREDKFGDVPAYRIVYTEGKGSAQVKYLQVFAVKGGNSYIVTYTAPAETFDKYLPKAEEIVSSYRIK